MDINSVKTKRKYGLLVLLIFIILTAIGLSAYRRYQTQSSLVEIKQRGVLRVGLDASFPPFETLNGEGNIVGLDPAIATAIATDLGVEVQFVNIGFDGLYDALKIGRVDMLLSGLPIDPYLTADVAYSVNYFNAGQVLLSRNSAITSIDDLAGQTVAVEWGSLGDMEGRRLQQTMPGLKLNAQPDAQTAMQQPIAIVDAVSALSVEDARIIDYLSEDWYSAAVNIEDKALLTEINNTLTRLIESGEMARMQTKWFKVEMGR